MMFDHSYEYPSQWAAIESIAGKMGCATQTSANWVRQAKCDAGLKSGPMSEERACIK